MNLYNHFGIEESDILISSDNSSERINKLVFNENSKIRNKKSHKKLKTDEEIDKNLISSYANKKLNKYLKIMNKINH